MALLRGFKIVNRRMVIYNGFLPTYFYLSTLYNLSKMLNCILKYYMAFSREIVSS